VVRAVLVALSLTVALAAPISIAWLIFRFGVNVAVEDQIAIGDFLVRNHGRVFPALGDLFAQHNESRKVFPRLIFFYLARLTHWNVRCEMAVSWLIACGIAAGVWLLARRTIADRTVAIAATALAILLVFSPVQWWNWLFGIQIVVFLPMLMLVAALVVAPRRPLVAAICCLVAGYSYANGMILWLLVLPMLERRRAVIVGWVAAAAAAIGVYFIGYHKPAASPPMTLSAGVVPFVLTFLGHPLAQAYATLLGAIAVAAFALLAFRAGRAGLPWVLVGAYAIISAATTAAGRLALGQQAALEPRYTTFAIPIWIAIVMLGAMAMPRGRTLAAAAVLILHAIAITAAWPEIRANYRDRLLARAATQLCEVLPDQSLFSRLVERHATWGIGVVTQLAKIGYVNPSPLSSDTILQDLGAGTTRGAFEGVIVIGGQPLLYGWALMPDGKPADAVVIARVQADGDHPVALSERTVFRSDRPGVGWDLPAKESLDVAGSVYNAWAYDTATRRAYLLAGSIAFRKR